MKRFLILAIGLHAAVDMIAVSIYYYVFIGDVWLVEGILFAMTLLVAIFTYLIVKRYSPIRV